MRDCLGNAGSSAAAIVIARSQHRGTLAGSPVIAKYSKWHAFIVGGAGCLRNTS